MVLSTKEIFRTHSPSGNLYGFTGNIGISTQEYKLHCDNSKKELLSVDERSYQRKNHTLFQGGSLVCVSN